MINEAYFSTETHRQLRSFYESKEFKSITLADFLTSEFLEQVRIEIDALDFEKKDIATQYRYETAMLPSKIRSLLSSEQFLQILATILDHEVSGISGRLYRLTWQNYQILHDDLVKEPGIDIVIDLTETWNENWGGVVTYVDGEGQAFGITPSFGALTVVDRKPPMQFYISYINHYAKDTYRYLVIGEANLQR